MSCYEWEKGEWKLSCVEFRNLRNALIEGFNRVQEETFQKALRVKADFDRIRKDKAEFKRVMEQHFGWVKKNSDAYPQLLQYVCNIHKADFCVMRNALMVDVKIVPSTEKVEGYDSFNTFRKKDGSEWRRYTTSRKLPKNPKKNCSPKATKATTAFSAGGEAKISLYPDKRVVIWRVGENNHACEYAHAEPMARVFWSALSRVEWTRGTGGRLWGSDEYAEDAARERGGDPNRTKQTWGNQKEERRMRFAY